MISILLLPIVVIGLIVIVGCGYWVLSGTAIGGGFRTQAPNLNQCPNCGTTLDPTLDHCPKCSIRTSV